MKHSSFLWVIPFVSFLVGYYALSFFYAIPELETPCVVGKPLNKAIAILSDNNLNARLLAEKEDPDLPDYTIVSQTPREYAKIKAHQSVFLVVTRQPDKPKSPHLLGESIDTIRKKIASSALRCTYHYLESIYPKGQCIAQFPAPHEPLEDGSLLCYISKEPKKMVIWPDFRGKSIEIVQAFLQEKGLTAEINTDKKKRPDGIISDQRPLPGSIVTLDSDKIPPIQLYVK